MVPMPMAPDQRINLVLVHFTLVKDLINALGYVQSRNGLLDEIVDRRRKVPPVLSASQVEHDGPPGLFVFDVKCIGGQVHRLMALEDRLDKGLCRDDDVAGGVDDVDLDRGIALREVQGGVLLCLDFSLRHDECSCCCCGSSMWLLQIKL